MINVSDSIGMARDIHINLYNQLISTYIDLVSEAYEKDGKLINFEAYELLIRWLIVTGFAKCVEFLKLHHMETVEYDTNNPWK